MEPQFRFCTSADGTRIVFSVVGDHPGTPFVHIIGWAVALEWLYERPDFRAYDNGLAEGRRVIRLECRGLGASQRDVADLSLEAHLADLTAVLEELRLERFDLGGTCDGAVVALAYAARHAERVRRLLLWGPYASVAEFVSPEATRSWIELIRGNWGLARRAMAGTVFPSGPVDVQRGYARMLRENVSPEVAAKYVEFRTSVDIRPLLPQVKAPTLIMHRRGDRYVPLAVGRAVAGLMPDARFVMLEGDSVLLFDDWEKVVPLMREFLDERPAETPAAAATGLVTILFTDIASSTALTQRLGDAKAQELVRAHNTIVREALRAHGGAEIKHTGDGIMASFPTASGALECAIAIQRAVAERGVGAHGRAPLQVHIGLNAGEPIAEEADLFGTAVQLARRICDHVEAGQVLVSNVVRELAAGKGFLFSDRGEAVPKGFDEAVRLYEVRWQEL